MSPLITIFVGSSFFETFEYNLKQLKLNLFFYALIVIKNLSFLICKNTHSVSPLSLYTL